MATFGWHFVSNTLRDGRPVPADGEWLAHDGRLELCASGLHFSPTPGEALAYAPGPILCRVELDGAIVIDGDKGVASRRRIIARHDMTDILRQFAQDEAVRVLQNAPAVVREFVTGDDALRVAGCAVAKAAVAARAAAAAWAAGQPVAAAWAAARADMRTAQATRFNALVASIFGVD